MKSLKIIFEKCDIISLNLSLNDKTVKIINNKYLNILKKNQILINTSRGKIVDEKAIIKKLNNENFFTLLTLLAMNLKIT